MTTRFPVALALLALSCGSAESLRTPTLRPSDDPTVLATIDEQVGALEVDDSRVYWIGTAENGRTWTGALRSCLKRDCAATLVTYDGSGVVSAPGFGVVNGEVLWFHLINDEPSEWSLSACPVAGCEGSPRQVAHELTWPPNVAAFTPDAVYLESRQLFRIPLPAGGAPQFVATPRGDALSVAIQGEYIYWIESANAGPGGLLLAALQRAHADGSTPPELLASDFSFTGSGFTFGLTFPSRALALSSTHVYWTQGAASGSVARCPLSGCNSAPELLGEPIDYPGTLKLDAEHLYWQYETNPSGFGLSTCVLEPCASSPPIATDVDALNALAVDADYVYTATGTVVVSPSNLGMLLNPSAKIRRFPR